MRVAALYRYPVKGLSPERLAPGRPRGRRLFSGRPALCDRERPVGVRPGDAGASAQDQVPDADEEREPRPAHHPLRGRDAQPRRRRRRARGGRGPISAPPEGRLATEAFFRRFMPGELRGAAEGARRSGGLPVHRFPRGFVSLINLASVRDLEARLGAPVDPFAFPRQSPSSTGSRRGPSSTSSASADRAPRGCRSRSRSGSSAARQPTSTRRPACATSEIPQALSAIRALRLRRLRGGRVGGSPGRGRAPRRGRAGSGLAAALSGLNNLLKTHV